MGTLSTRRGGRRQDQPPFSGASAVVTPPVLTAAPVSRCRYPACPHCCSCFPLSIPRLSPLMLLFPAVVTPLVPTPCPASIVALQYNNRTRYRHEQSHIAADARRRLLPVVSAGRKLNQMHTGSLERQLSPAAAAKPCCLWAQQHVRWRNQEGLEISSLPIDSIPAAAAGIDLSHSPLPRPL